MPYDSLLVQPMRDELMRLGVQELRTTDDVETFLAASTGASLLFVNSICGCATSNARPALALALERGARPARVASVFAGQDVEATDRARSYFPRIPASSPSLYLIVDGELVWHLPRHRIEGRDASSVATDLTAACARNGAT